MLKKRRGVWSLVLSTALITAQLSAVTIAETAVPEDGSIASFATLDKSIKKQEVPAGTELIDLNLPDTLKARIYSVTSDVADAEQENGKAPSEENPAASPAEADKDEERVTTDASVTGNTKISTKLTSYDKEIPVTWDSSPVYNGDVIGNYVFTADVGSYILSEGVKLPQITVTVVGNKTTTQVPAAKNISDWSFVDDDNLNEGVLPLSFVSIDNQADFDTVVSMLPTQILAEIDDGESTATGREKANEEAVKIISWNCPEYQEDGQGNWPVSGEYTFTAELESGYRCNPLPSVKVMLGGASLFTINDRFAVDGLLYKELGPDTVQLIGYKGDEPEGELHIPSQVVKPENGRTYEVVSIGSEVFAFCDKLTGDLVIPHTVTNIGNMAFMSSGFDGALVLPDGLTEISDSAFYQCSFTGTLKLPDSLTEIGRNAFSGCHGFTGPLVIPKQLTVIRKNAFSSCLGIESLEMPEGLTEIQDFAFASLYNIKKPITFPSSLTLIGVSAFSGLNDNCEEFKCPNPTIAGLLLNSNSSIFYPKVTVNGKDYYDWANQLQEFRVADSGTSMRYIITGPDTVTAAGPTYLGLLTGMLDIPGEVTHPTNGNKYVVTAIGANAFAMHGITGVSIPDTVTKIENSAFSNCTGLTGPLVIPDTVTEIGSSAFSECYGFDSLTLPSGLTEIGDEAFFYCMNLTGTLILPPGLTRIGSSAFSGCRNLTGPLVLPSGLTHIGERAFYECLGLTGAFLDKNVTFIGWNAFDPGFPLTANSPQVQLLINEYSNRRNPVDTFWDGGEDIPDGALVRVNQDVTLDQDRRIGREAEATVEKGVILTTNGTLTVDGILRLNGKLIINGTLKGSGKLVIGRNGEVIGDISGMSVEYWDDLEDAKHLIESYAYSIPGAIAGNAEAVKRWLSREIPMISGFSATGVNVGEITVTSFTLAEHGTNGSFAFDVLLFKGDSSDKATGLGSVSVSSSSGGGGGSYTNPDILRGTWIQTENGIWIFRQTGGEYAKSRWGLIGGLWYYFNADGHMLTGWQQLNGVWYYLHTAEDAGSTAGIQAGVKEGAMKTGWHFDSLYQQWFYFNINGAMATGWREINGKWYYFGSENNGTRGTMYADRITPDGYYVDKNGVCDWQSREEPST